MPSSRRRHGQDSTLLSWLVRVGGVNRIGDKSRLLATEHLETEQCLLFCSLSNIWKQCEHIFVFSRPCFRFATRSVGNCDKLVCKGVHSADMYGQNCSVSNILRWKLSKTVANSVHTTDKTRQSYLLQYLFYFIVHETTALNGTWPVLAFSI